jgi:hypothetical protein
LPAGGKVVPSAPGKQETIMTATRTILLSALILVCGAVVATWTHASSLTAGVVVPAGIDTNAIQSQIDARTLPEQTVTLDWIGETSRFNRGD